MKKYILCLLIISTFFWSSTVFADSVSDSTSKSKSKIINSGNGSNAEASAQGILDNHVDTAVDTNLEFNFEASKNPGPLPFMEQNFGPTTGMRPGVKGPRGGNYQSADKILLYQKTYTIKQLENARYKKHYKIDIDISATDPMDLTVEGNKLPETMTFNVYAVTGEWFTGAKQRGIISAETDDTDVKSKHMIWEIGLAAHKIGANACDIISQGVDEELSTWGAGIGLAWSGADYSSGGNSVKGGGTGISYANAWEDHIPFLEAIAVTATPKDKTVTVTPIKE